MSVKKLRRLPLAAAALVACVGAQAEYQSPDGNFRMSGFGTLGAVRTSTDDALYNYPGQGAGATKHASLNPDTKAAVQGTYKVTPTVSGTAQVMTKTDAYGNYTPNMEWAFAKWQAAPSLSFRAGRMGAPLFMISDFRDVGYANTFVRPPLDVYGQVPISNFEGADATFQFELGSSHIAATLWTGDSKAEYASSLNNPPADVTIKRNVGLNIQAELFEGLSVRVGRSQGKLTIRSSVSDRLTAGAGTAGMLAPSPANGLPKLKALSTALSDPVTAAAAQAAMDQLSQVPELLNPDSVSASFTGLGLAYDQDNWVGSLEYTKRKTKSYVADTTGWYGVIGYRVAKFTPFVGYSKIKSDRRASNPLALTNFASTANGALSALASGLDDSIRTEYAGINAALGTQKMDEKTATIGVRWDATSSLAVKAQFDQVRKPADSNGMFLLADPSATASQAFTAQKRTINVVTLSVDFVF